MVEVDPIGGDAKGGEVVPLCGGRVLVIRGNAGVADDFKGDEACHYLGEDFGSVGRRLLSAGAGSGFCGYCPSTAA